MRSRISFRGIFGTQLLIDSLHALAGNSRRPYEELLTEAEMTLK